MKNHAHDSIGCCCSDKVHRAIADRFFLAEERADRLIDFYMRKIVDGMDCDLALDKLTVFNLMPYERTGVFRGEIVTKQKNFVLKSADGTVVDYKLIKKEVVDAGLIDRQIVHYGDYDPFVRYTVLVQNTVPAMGYATYLVLPEEGEKALAVQSKDQPILENEYYRIQVEENGTLTVLDKEKNLTLKDVLLVEDGADDGDGYDYSGLADDMIVTSRDAAAECAVRDLGLAQEADIRFTMCIPKNLESRKAKTADETMEVRFHISLAAGSRTVGVRFLCDNRAEDHRVRVLVPCGASAHSRSDNQFGKILRPVRDPAMDVWETERWSERPDSIYPFLTYVTSQEGQGFSAITDSIREYEIIGENYDTLALTMFRCVGFLGKEEMFRRPGRPSGIRMETPDSQMRGIQSFTFHLTTEKEHLAALAKETVTPLITYNKMPYNAMKLNPSGIQVPYHYSLLQLEGDAVLSALKEAENGEGLIARFYNSGEEETKLQLSGHFSAVQEVNLNEEAQAQSGMDTTLKVNQIRTYLLKP